MTITLASTDIVLQSKRIEVQRPRHEQRQVYRSQTTRLARMMWLPTADGCYLILVVETVRCEVMLKKGP